MSSMSLYVPLMSPDVTQVLRLTCPVHMLVTGKQVNVCLSCGVGPYFIRIFTFQGSAGPGCPVA